jgi:hypothetical protein
MTTLVGVAHLASLGAQPAASVAGFPATTWTLRVRGDALRRGSEVACGRYARRTGMLVPNRAHAPAKGAPLGVR